MEDIYILAGAAAVVGIAAMLVKIGAWKGRMDEHRDTASSFMEEIRADIKRILGRLSPALEGSSPIRLTDLGRRVSEKLELSSWASQEAARFREYTAGKSAYDIQEFCFDYVRNEFKPDTDQEAAIKECAFQNGIDTQSVLDVLAVELRDVLLGDKEPPEHRSTG